MNNYSNLVQQLNFNNAFLYLFISFKIMHTIMIIKKKLLIMQKNFKPKFLLSDLFNSNILYYIQYKNKLIKSFSN